MLLDLFGCLGRANNGLIEYSIEIVKTTGISRGGHAYY